MKILLATLGSEGDFRPFLALAKGLLAKGHEVAIASSDNYEAKANAAGVPFHAVGAPWNHEEVREVFARILRERSPLDHLRIVAEYTKHQTIGTVSAFEALLADADLLVYHPLAFVAAAVARKRGLAHASLQFAPMRRAASYSPTGHNFGSLINGLVWWAALGAMRRASDASLNEVVAAAGLPPWKDVLMEAALSDALDLVAVSPALFPRDRLWPETTKLTGYLFLDEPDFAVDVELRAFVDGVAPKKPLVIGFGSMLGFDAAKISEVVANAVRDLDHPVVIQSGWSGLAAAGALPHVHVAKFVPHDWLLPRAFGMVHHGGAGTTAAAMRAGIPQAVVWHLGDQPVWGKHVHRRGLGPKPISHHDLTSARLRAQINAMLGSPSMVEAARALGEQIRNEDGVGAAVEAIERTFGA
jgi:sterol 3beta-glucosyltransferase